MFLSVLVFCRLFLPSRLPHRLHLWFTSSYFTKPIKKKLFNVSLIHVLFMYCSFFCAAHILYYSTHQQQALFSVCQGSEVTLCPLEVHYKVQNCLRVLQLAGTGVLPVQTPPGVMITTGSAPRPEKDSDFVFLFFFCCCCTLTLVTQLAVLDRNSISYQRFCSETFMAQA